MSKDGILILRETVISIVINVVLSILFFVFVFGFAAPVSLGALGPDFYPQTFMITLMGTLVPAMLLRRTMGGPVYPIVLRSLCLAVAFTALPGTIAYLACMDDAGSQLPVSAALILKATYGGVLAAVVTPLALRAVIARKAAA